MEIDEVITQHVPKRRRPEEAAKRVEVKSVDWTFNPIFGNDDSLANKILEFNQANVGPQAWNRIGQSIRCQSVSIRGIIYLDTGGSVPPNEHLVMVIVRARDQQTPTLWSDLYRGRDVLGGVSTVPGYQTFVYPNRDNEGAFQELWRKTVRISAEGELSNQTYSNNMSIDEEIDLGGLETRFNRTPIAIYDGDIRKNGLYFIVQGQVATTLNAEFAGQFAIRFNFTDE